MGARLHYLNFKKLALNLQQILTWFSMDALELVMGLLSESKAQLKFLIRGTISAGKASMPSTYELSVIGGRDACG